MDSFELADRVCWHSKSREFVCPRRKLQSTAQKERERGRERQEGQEKERNREHAKSAKIGLQVKLSVIMGM